MKTLAALLLLLVFPSFSAAQVILGAHRQSVSCVAPAITTRLAPYNPANTCTGGCTNGNPIANLADFDDGRSAPDSHGAATYTTGVLSQPIMRFSNTVSGYVYTVTPLVGTYYVIANTSCSFCTLGAGNNGDQSLNWRINSDTIQVNSQGQAVLVTTSTGVTGAWHLFILEYDSSNNVTVRMCNGGSCSIIGSGNAGSHIPGAGMLSLGAMAGLDASFLGDMAEFGYDVSSSYSPTALAAWSWCWYHV